MNSFLRYISVTILSLLVLVSTTSMSVGMHYCGDNLVDYSFFSKADNCMMNAKTTTSKSCNSSSKKCCDDIEINIDGQQDIQSTDFDFNLQNQLFFSSFVYTYFHIIQKENKAVFQIDNYAPPRISLDIQVLEQVFIL